MLLIRGADINAADSKGYTPLLVSLEHGHVDVALILLNRGANTVLRNNNYMNSLHFAAMSNSVAVCSLLLERGMDINDKDVQGNTPLLVALNRGNIEVGMMLSQVPSTDFSVRNKEGKTAYDIALSKNMSNIVGRIIECQEILKLKSLRQDEYEYRARQNDSAAPLDGKAKAQSASGGSASEQQMLADAVRRGMAKSKVESGSGSAGMMERGNDAAETISQITFDMGNLITDNNGNVLKKEKKERTKEERERREKKKKKKRDKERGELKSGEADDSSHRKSKSSKSRSVAEGGEGETSTIKSGRSNKSSKSSRLRSLLYEDDANTIMESSSVHSKSKAVSTPQKSSKGSGILDDGRSPELNVYKKPSPGFIFCGGRSAMLMDEPVDLTFDDERSVHSKVSAARKSSDSSILCGAGAALPRQDTGGARQSLAASNRRALQQARRKSEEAKGGCVVA